jgi:glycine cleavage system H protein
MASYPDDVRYTDKHQWVRTREKIVTLGITQFAADRLGAIGFVELPYPGELFKPGALIGRIQADGSSSAMYMPFVGQINAVNKALDGGAGVINSDPYGEGWILRIEPNDMGEVEALMDAEQYAAFVAAADEA